MAYRRVRPKNDGEGGGLQFRLGSLNEAHGSDWPLGGYGQERCGQSSHRCKCRATLVVSLRDILIPRLDQARMRMMAQCKPLLASSTESHLYGLQQW